MVAIESGNKWDDNHDSSYSLDEMKALIRNICVDIPEMANPPATLATEFKKLSDIILGKTEIGVVFLMKGIHQENELHYNIKCVASGGSSEYHVYLKKGNTVKVKTAGLKATPLRDKQGISGGYAEVPLFKYKNSGLSWQHHEGAPMLLCPAVFEKNGYPGRKRKDSFSIGNCAPIKARGPGKDETMIMPPPK